MPGKQEFPSCFAQAAVLVIGDLMLDEYLFGTVNRISPEAPVPVVDIRQRRYVPGGAANVSANIRSLGANVRLVGVCGEDSAGEKLRSVLHDAGIDDKLVIGLKNRATICKTRVIAGQQQIVRFDTEDRTPLDGEVRDLISARLASAVSECDVCVLSDYGKGLLTPEICDAAIARARRSRIPVIVDPKGLDFSKYSGCSLITPNLKEAAQATGIAVECESDLFEAGRRLLNMLRGASALVTRGSEGMTLFREGAEPMTIPTVAQEVFDVVGAGDTAVATLSVALAAGMPLETGTRLANIAAGIAVGKHGTVAVSAHELLNHLEARRLLENAPRPSLSHN